MSTLAKTKRDKKVMNDTQKTPNKASGSMGASTGVTAGAYNPLLGTFQSVEPLSATGSSSLHNNGRFRNIEESDSTGADCDSISNNGSWSGDSEDHKEKVSNPATKQEIIPGADNDKREKIRLKNERKHQRQKEKRAQELHERCSQYLMSRKLEVLAQQLVAMGISQERATQALMLNEGKLVESINWLFDDGGAKASEKQLDPTPGNLKLDISQEFSKILELEAKYKCSKQDVERAVVGAEGNIETAEEILRKQKQEQQYTASRKAEDISDTTSTNNNKVSSMLTSQNTVAQLQPNYTAGEEALERKNLGYTRGSSYVSGESGNQSFHSLDTIQMKLELMKLQQNAVLGEKKWSSRGSNTPMLYHQPPLAPPTAETHYLSVTDQLKKLQQQEMREPVMVMQQRSQSANTNMLPVSTMNSSFTGAANGWYPTSRSEAAAQSNGFNPNVSSSRPLAPNDLNSNLMYQQLQYHQYHGQVNGHRNQGGSSPGLAPAASLGLFSGIGSVPSSGSPSGLDWNTDGSIGQLDYNHIDWSLDNKSLSCPRPNKQYVGGGSLSSSYEAHMNGRTRITANGHGLAMAGVQEGGVGPRGDVLVGNGRDWTSPFEGKDLFSLSRQYVPPSL